MVNCNLKIFSIFQCNKREGQVQVIKKSENRQLMSSKKEGLQTSGLVRNEILRHKHSYFMLRTPFGVKIHYYYKQIPIFGMEGAAGRGFVIGGAS